MLDLIHQRAFAAPAYARYYFHMIAFGRGRVIALNEGFDWFYEILLQPVGDLQF
jgi:hypothetical protein